MSTNPAPTVESPVPDFYVRNEGTIFLLSPMSDRARNWIRDNLPDNAQTLGNSTAIEHRYVCDILDGIHRDGLIAKPV